MSNERKNGKEYVNKAGRLFGLSQTRIVHQCAAEADVSERIAREVLFHNADCTTNPRRRAFAWGVKNKIFPAQRERKYPDTITSALNSAEERDAKQRVATAEAEDPEATAQLTTGPVETIKSLTSHLEDVLERIERGERGLSSDAYRKQLEARVRAISTKGDANGGDQ